MGERGRRAVGEQYSVDAMKDGFVSLAARVLEESAAGSEPQDRQLIS